jgi:hypothetical protein
MLFVMNLSPPFQIFERGFLQEEHKTLFVPELPAEHQRCISALGMGYVEKIFVKFLEEVKVPDDASPADREAEPDGQQATDSTSQASSVQLNQEAPPSTPHPEEPISSQATKDDFAHEAEPGRAEQDGVVARQVTSGELRPKAEAASAEDEEAQASPPGDPAQGGSKGSDTDSVPPVYAYQFLWASDRSAGHHHSQAEVGVLSSSSNPIVNLPNCMAPGEGADDALAITWVLGQEPEIKSPRMGLKMCERGTGGLVSDSQVVRAVKS